MWHLLPRHGIAWGLCEVTQMPATRNPKKQRNGKRMLLTMGAVIASVGLVVGYGPFTGISPPASATHPENMHCTYEAGESGDISATITNDQGAGAADGLIDDGGCIFVMPDINDNACTLTILRAGPLLGTLTNTEMNNIGDGMSVDMMELEEQAEPGEELPDCDLRELPVTSGRVEITVSIVDDVYGSGAVGGAICTEAANDDYDHVACDEGLLTGGEINEEFCNGGPFTVTVEEISEVDAIVVYTNGPKNQADHCDLLLAQTATTGGILDPAGGVYISFEHA